MISSEYYLIYIKDRAEKIIVFDRADLALNVMIEEQDNFQGEIVFASSTNLQSLFEVYGEYKCSNISWHLPSPTIEDIDA
jgi:hypothetical protein